MFDNHRKICDVISSLNISMKQIKQTYRKTKHTKLLGGVSRYFTKIGGLLRKSLAYVSALMVQLRYRAQIDRFIQSALITKNLELEAAKMSSNDPNWHIFLTHFRMGMSIGRSDWSPERGDSLNRTLSTLSDEKKVYAYAGYFLGLFEHIYSREESILSGDDIRGDDRCRNPILWYLTNSGVNSGEAYGEFQVGKSACLAFLVGMARLRYKINIPSRLENRTNLTPLEQALLVLNLVYDSLDRENQAKLQTAILRILDEQLVKPALGECIMSFLESVFNILFIISYYSGTDFTDQIFMQFVKVARQYERRTRIKEMDKDKETDKDK